MEMPVEMGYGPRFRNQLPEGAPKEGSTDSVRLIDLTVFQRIPIVKEIWPYHFEKG